MILAACGLPGPVTGSWPDAADCHRPACRPVRADPAYQRPGRVRPLPPPLELAYRRGEHDRQVRWLRPALRSLTIALSVEPDGPRCEWCGGALPLGSSKHVDSAAMSAGWSRRRPATGSARRTAAPADTGITPCRT